MALPTRLIGPLKSSRCAVWDVLRTSVSTRLSILFMTHPRQPHDQNWIIPVGTQVVALIEVRAVGDKVMHPRGAVGIITEAPRTPGLPYRVRFPDSFESVFHREQLALLKHYKQHAMTRPATDTAASDLYERVIFRCIVGSRAFGLETQQSDTDRRGIYLAAAERHWSLYGVPEQLENDVTQEAYWELQKFLVMALKANPNVLECLYSPFIEWQTPLATELLAMKECFLSQLVYQTFNGYVMSQFKKLAGDLRNRGQIKWKHVMHLLRLLWSGITVLESGYVPVRVEQHREALLAIKRGEWSWDDVERWRAALHQQFSAAIGKTKLPERPDYERVNAFLIKARRAALSHELP